MLRRPYEVLERAVCVLARSSEPIQRRLGVASSIIGELRPEDFDNCHDISDTFQNLAALMPRSEGSHDTQKDFQHLTDKEAEYLAANLFDVFVDVAAIHLGTRQSTSR
jgi:hypothetical protein